MVEQFFIFLLEEAWWSNSSSILACLPDWLTDWLTHLVERFQTKIEEEWLCQASPQRKMKKNCSTRLLLEEKWRRTALPSLSKGKSRKNCSTRPAFSAPRMRKNLFTTLLLQEKWRRNALPGPLWSKNEKEWVYQASSEGTMQTNCSTRPSRSQKKRRIGVQERPLSSRAEKTQSHTIAVLYGRRFSGLNLNQNFKAIGLQPLKTKI